MTGLEKFAIAAVVSATGAQITVGSAGTLFNIAWAVIGAVLGMGVSYGMMRQRMSSLEEGHKRLEKGQEKLASKEAVEALTGHVETLVRMLDSRIIERRQS